MSDSLMGCLLWFAVWNVDKIKLINIIIKTDYQSAYSETRPEPLKELENYII